MIPQIGEVVDLVKKTKQDAKAHVTSDQFREVEMQTMLLSEPTLKGIGPEHASLLTKWFCTPVNYKAAENVGGQPQQLRHRDTEGGENVGGRVVHGDGQAPANWPKGEEQDHASDENMCTDVSESEAEAEARKMNGDKAKGKIWMKR